MSDEERSPEEQEATEEAATGEATEERKAEVEAQMAASAAETLAEEEKQKLADLAAKDQADAKKAEAPPAPEAKASIAITIFDNETATYQAVGIDRYGVGRVFEALANGARQMPVFLPKEKPASE